MGEIILAQVLLSQIGNILMLVAGIAVARLLLRGEGQADANPPYRFPETSANRR